MNICEKPKIAVADIMQGATDILCGMAGILKVGRNNHSIQELNNFLQNIWEWIAPPLLMLLRNGIILIWLLYCQ